MDKIEAHMGTLHSFKSVIINSNRIFLAKIIYIIGHHFEV
jgi:hypothetical protein